MVTPLVLAPLAALVAVPPALLGLEWDYTLRNVVLGSAIIGAVGGVFGTFATLRRQSLLGDALAHAALPGVCLAYLLTGAKTSLALLLGAAASGLVGTLVLLAITRQSRVKEDAALGVVLSVFFGGGILLLTRIQHTGQAAQSGLNQFLFGQAATLLAADVRLMAILGTITVAIVWLLFKEFKLLAFDPDFAASLGFAPTPMAILLTSLIVVAVVIGLQTVGVVLMVAMLIAPPTAARQWTDRLSMMTLLAAAFGAIAGVGGAVLSSEVARLPTGPTAVLVATLLAAVSILAAPRRGIIWSAVGDRRRRSRLAAEGVLRDLAGAGDGRGGITVRELAARRGQAPAAVGRALRRLARAGWAAPAAVMADGWRLTAAGADAAALALHRERLWKLYLARQMDLPLEAVHHGADEIERVLTPRVLAALETELATEPGFAGPVPVGAGGQR